ncbi:MAG: alpha/beta fold hydrolase [Cohaesibacter sp.]|nr:alpha/beta fold hydrolase [Cohaesibacter sp.]
MNRQKDLDDLRSELIGRVYDVVLHPESHDAFLADWGDYISRKSAVFHDRKNSSDQSEEILDDLALETHFARAHIILEKLGRPQKPLTQRCQEQKSGILFGFNRDGVMTSISSQAQALFEDLSHAGEVEDFLETKSAKDWRTFLAKLKRSPSLASFFVFSLAEGGNLIAHTIRDPDSDQIEVVVKYLKIDWSDELLILLSRRFGLSQRELELLQDLSKFGSLDVVVKQNSQSKNTIRTQMKSIFRKMNVSAQPELMQSVSMLAYLCDCIGHDDYVHFEQPIVGQMRRFAVSTGQDVPVHFIGPSKGKPILFLHGMLDGVAITAKILDVLHEKNLRLIAPVRPNFGSAGPSDQMKAMPHKVAEQAVHILDVLDIAKVPIIGHMSGSVFAFATAAKLAGRAEAVINISGGVPILSTRQFSKVAPRQRAFAYTARYAPAMFPILLRAGVAQIDAMKTEELMNDLYPSGSIDRQVVQDRHIANVVADGYHFAVAQGYTGFQYDAYHVTRNWSDLVSASPAPVLLLHGRHDPVVPIHTVRDFAEREHAKLVEYADDGQLIYYSRPDLLFEEICQFLKDQKSAPEA